MVKEQKPQEFTEDFLEKFFEDNFIEDDNMYDFLKGRIGTIEEDEESFPEEKRKMILNIKLVMGEDL